MFFLSTNNTIICIKKIVLITFYIIISLYSAFRYTVFYCQEWIMNLSLSFNEHLSKKCFLNSIYKTKSSKTSEAAQDLSNKSHNLPQQMEPELAKYWRKHIFQWRTPSAEEDCVKQSKGKLGMKYFLCSHPLSRSKCFVQLDQLCSLQHLMTSLH